MNPDIIATKKVASNSKKASSTSKGFRSINKLSVVTLVLFVLAATSAIYFYVQYNHAKNNPNSITAAQTSQVVSEVGKLMNLPTNETPTIATVSNKGKLANQPFFKNAQNGDKLLIYTNAKEAILYRPSTNKIINVGPIVLNNGTTKTGITSTSGTSTAKK